MLSAFSEPINIVFTDDNLAEDAIWRAGGTAVGIPVRVVRKTPDEIVSFGASRTILPSAIIAVRGSEVASPASGDTVQIGIVVFDIIAEPRHDNLGLVWECEVVPRS